jgi:hypothetical protein
MKSVISWMTKSAGNLMDEISATNAGANLINQDEIKMVKPLHL